MRIVVLDDYQRCAHRFADWDSLDADVDFSHHHLTGSALVERLDGAEVVVVMRERTPFDRDLLERLPDLRLLVTTGMHNAAIDLDAAHGCGVTVCGTRGTDGPAAEMTWALILAVARQVPHHDHAVRSGGWQDGVGLDLDGARLGVIGLGRLGRRVADVGRAFGMDVVAWSQNLDPDVARDAGATPVGQDELLSTSDVVTLHVRLSARTRALIGPAELARMKPTAILVNTSRGPLVDTDALLDALRGGRLGGAGLDVFDTEPLTADDPWRSAPRTVLSPHLGFVTEGSYRVFYGDAVADVSAWKSGAPVRRLSK